MKSEFEANTLKSKLIKENLENHTYIQKELNNKMPELKALITGITARQEQIENGLNSRPNIAFLAHRITDGYNIQNSTIPYQTNVLNFGGAFNKTSGLFQVPVNGIYHFYFAGIYSRYFFVWIRQIFIFPFRCNSAIKMKREISGTSRLTVQLKKIGKPEAVLAEGHVNSEDWYGWFPVQMQATIYLDKGSLIGVQLTEGSIYQSTDASDLHNSFGGFLVSPAN